RRWLGLASFSASSALHEHEPVSGQAPRPRLTLGPNTEGEDEMDAAIAADRRIAILIGLALALAVPLLPLAGALATNAKLDLPIAREAVMWGVAALVVLYSLMVEGRGFATMGFRAPDWKTIVFGVLGAVATVAFAGSLITFGFPLLHI